MVMTPCEFIRHTQGAPFAWGECDCALWAANFVRARTGHDPARIWRGTYCTAFACRNMLMQRGGIERVIRQAMARFVAGERQNGVALAWVGGRLCCGVLADGRMWVKTSRGVRAPGDVRIVEGWTV